MPIHYMRDVSVVLAGATLSDHVESVEVAFEYDQVEVTAMGATARAFIPGLRDDTITLNFYADFDSAKVDQTINPLLGSSSGGTMIIKPTTSAVSATNPSYTAIVAPYTYSPLNGSVGDANMTSVEFKPIAGQSITRGTT